jgi:hypothetical protein
VISVCLRCVIEIGEIEHVEMCVTLQHNECIQALAASLSTS